ncbi:MAG: Fis family transcriptional regulator [Deltaproteobacteria bacterium HGW-Deltaproteobacteria-15]|jgi:PAS domain S-box-containing protein|nr:MAG: Fis family transcriptional regulator [Deltaproteobacteria bacterium HGW-Deltaproteobacteria-15]
MENQTKIILDSIADGVFTVDSELKITSFNRSAEKITGIMKEAAVGRYCWEVFKASICEKRCALKHTMDTGRSMVNQSVYIVNLEGEQVPISISTALLKDGQGNVIGGVETFRDLSMVEELRRQLSGRHSFQDIISKNKEMQRLFGMLEQVSESDATVLIQGESGTGKELFAKAIHSLGPRKNGPMITINCGSLPDTLLESELFGYEKGAHSTAFKDKPGRLTLANGGTLFLDEIGDISPALQVRLLRVLQDKTYEPLGSTKAQKTDVRIVAATNKNLEELVREGKFRQDLYYRINVVKMVLPPLRERREDIPLLVDHFIRKFNRLSGREIQGMSLEVMPLLMSHDFPGNIRELENIIEYATVVSKNGHIGIEHLPDALRKGQNISMDEASSRSETKEMSFDEIERNFYSEALRQNNWKRAATAAQLGIHPTTLWRKMKKLNIETPEKAGRKMLDDYIQRNSE